MILTHKERESFWSRVVLKQFGCWEWLSQAKCNYGRFTIRGVRMLAHRYAYEEVFGPIPDQLPLDHLCRNPRCVNPDHLEPVTQKENILRGVAPAAINKRKTHCQHGHELVESNLHQPTLAQGRRRCLTCETAYQLLYAKTRRKKRIRRK